MNGDCSIYQQARKARGLTQEAAAELLDISVRTLAGYETGERLPGDDTVERMAAVYGTPMLVYQHVRVANALAGKIIPPMEERSLIELTLRLFNRIRRFSQNKSLERLMEIAEDNRIDETEQADFQAILLEIQGLVQYGMELGAYYGAKK